MSNKTVPFGPAFVLACDALGISDHSAAVAIVKYIPKAEALAVKDADDVVRLIVKSMGLHVESAMKRNAEKGIVAPLVEAEADVNELYGAYEEGQAKTPHIIDVAQLVPGTGTLQ